MTTVIERIEFSVDELEQVLRETESVHAPEQHRKLRALLDAYLTLTDLIGDEKTTLRKLRALFEWKTEKTRDVLAAVSESSPAPAGEGEPPGAGEPAASQSAASEEPPKRRGHGRTAAKGYPGAKRVEIEHTELNPGDPCPTCSGKVYEQRKRAVLVRITGGPPLSATVYERQQLRCNLCGEVYAAPLPENVPDEKYDAPAAAMIALLKYGSGLPFNRLACLQGSLGVPLPASTQWEIVRDAARALEGVYEALIDEAAVGEVLHNDDTSMPVLALRKVAPEPEEGIDPSRTGVFTSGIVSKRKGRRIALYFTGRRHAGENLEHVLSRRAPELSAPMQMSDALSRNLPKEFEVIVGHCLVHGRRNFVKRVENFPAECRHVLEELAKVYRVEARAREEELSPEERLALHQRESAPVLEDLKARFDAALAERRVEPNSGLGQAIGYMTKRWESLTLFLRVPGAPLDNNICERALKKVILHRKNALFYKTPRGARTGDIFQSLIHTTELGGGNPFEYLTAVLGHRAEVERDPASWLPWNYAAALGRVVAAGGA